jgi:diguanylate cyclase (GGDEF)-like protein
VILLPLAYESFSNTGVSAAAAMYSGILVAIGLAIAMSYNQYHLALARKRIRKLAAVDPLTGVFNRREFERRMQKELDGLSYSAVDALAIVMIDLDNFKRVNTEHGHRAGDELLAGIAAALDSVSRGGDCVARIGGDEFAAVLPNVDAAVAQKLARRFLDAVAEETSRSPLPACRAVTASAGFALYGLHGRTLDELVNAADVALMSVKTSGKGVERVSSFVVNL